jgi:Skp family chaperone for outer membrane proteins
LKTCSVCKAEKEVSEFSKRALGRDGLNYWCRACDSAEKVKYYKENLEKVKAANAKYYKENSDKVKASNAKYRAENPEKKKANNARWYAENSEKCKAKDARWRAENPEKCRAIQSKYRTKNLQKTLVSSAKRRAKAKGLPFDLESSDVFIPVRCPALGLVIKREVGPIADNSAQLDRVIPAKGYVKGNVQILSARANRVKSDATPTEVRRVYRHMRGLPPVPLKRRLRLPLTSTISHTQGHPIPCEPPTPPFEQPSPTAS